MATDIFSREVNYGGAFSADGASVQFAGYGAGFLIQSLRWTYQQQITRLYEVGSPDIYLVAGRTQGSVAMQRVLGPLAIATAFYQQYGNVCGAGQNNLSFTMETGCGGAAAGTQTIDIRHAVISQIGGAVSAQDMVIHETLAMMFLFMNIA
jgi:hypothetical protein